MTWFEERAQLDGTVAVVTGGAGGLGEAITHDLAANGVRVAVVDRDADAVERTIAALDRAGREHIVRVGDAREEEVLSSLFREVDGRWGRLDTLVNVVGGTFRAPFTETTPNAWDVLLRTNLMHVLHACSLAIPRMKAGGRGGSIVNITTIEGHRAAPGFAVYSAAKAAVIHFARTLSVELAEFGIRVNNVAPDITPTPNMGAISGSGSTWDSPLGIRIAIPMGRVGVPQDTSNAVVFLASGLSSYITGTTLHPDGGTYASSGWFNWPEQGYANSIPRSVLDALGS
jgi:NAD(P)-dependent dehydrogenase (short-subunit alcohol dehydrogenase family)